MVIPSYWSRKASAGWQPGDAVYDHPTPLDGEDTLTRTLESLAILENKEFALVILACATAREIEQEVEARVREIVLAADPPVVTYVISHSHLAQFYEALTDCGREDLHDVLSLRGYWLLKLPTRNLLNLSFIVFTLLLNENSMPLGLLILHGELSGSI